MQIVLTYEDRRELLRKAASYVREAARTGDLRLASFGRELERIAVAGAEVFSAPDPLLGRVEEYEILSARDEWRSGPEIRAAAAAAADGGVSYADGPAPDRPPSR